MNNVAIKVENLGKKYVINHEKENGDNTFREVIVSGTKKIISSLNPLSENLNDVDKSTEEFWALNDVNFEINKGDKVGIIGRNGAGKSTLLKVLSRITEPTTGKIHINGRIASLLEVGTGFHPELTGRENIYLNGTILGMSRKEIKDKFNEIVAFAEVEKFLDTPVKRYSSGMYVRLAFSVAAHLEPEILIVDEVLAVGDIEFQKKCLGKMKDVSDEGRTIIFVSHNMAAIENLCDKGIVLNNGKVEYQSNNIFEVVSKFLKVPDDINCFSWENNDSKYKHPSFAPQKFWLSRVNGNEVLTSAISNNEEVRINIKFEVEEVDKALAIGYQIYSAENELLYVSLATDEHQLEWPTIKRGTNILFTSIPSHYLNEGEYRVELVASLFEREWIIEASKDEISVVLRIRGGLSKSPYWLKVRGGSMAPIFKWSAE